ncbi:MAG: FtsX-like permease family protein, partial [bacterium]|nr:FtsX-like permease family protein [bacterium]
LSMFRNYFKVSLRNIKRHKSYSLLNILGLSVGLACVILIFIYIRYEMSFDRFHGNLDRIYRISTDMKPPNDTRFWKLASTDWPVGIILREDYPEVEKLALISRSSRFSIKYNNRHFYERMIYADENFFDIFTFPLLKGDPRSALLEPSTIVITRDMEEKYFGEESGMGKTLVLNDSLLFTVSGIAENVPENSHLQFDILISFATYRTYNPSFGGTDIWGNINIYNFVLLEEGSNGESFGEKIKNLIHERSGGRYEGWGYEVRLIPDPLKDIYLTDDRNSGLGPNGNISYVYFLSAVAVFILIIASINFINLTTARSTERAREVGIRKVVGSIRKSLIKQFLLESVIIGFIAMVIAVCLALLSLDHFNNLTNRSFAFYDLISVELAFFLSILVLAVGLLAGIYPAFIISGFTPVHVLKGAFKTDKRSIRIRESLVIFQFAISVGLIFSTLIVFDQLKFMLNQDTGFDKEQVVVVDISNTPYSSRGDRYEPVKQELLTHNGVINVTAAGAVPGKMGWGGQFAFPEGKSQDDGLAVEYIPVDHDYVKTVGLKIVAGRDFSELYGLDWEEALLINEASVKAMGWDTPENSIGKRINSPSGYPAGVVVGVVKDYNHHDLRSLIRPIVLDINPGSMRYFAVKIDAEDTGEVLDHIKNTWDRLYQGYDYKYFFLDEEYARQYESEERLINIFSTFACLAIFISCLGLLGLASYMAKQKTKEIGIRKVLGGTVFGISKLLIREFLKLVVIANAVSLPAAFYIMSNWLENFAYRTDLGSDLIIFTVSISILVSLITISFQTIKAAVANPVNSLRYE